MAEFGLCLDYSTNLTDYGHMIPLLLVPIIAFVVFATIALKPTPAFRCNGQAYNSDSLVRRTTFERTSFAQVGNRPYARALLVSDHNVVAENLEMQFRTTSHSKISVT